MPWPSSLRQAVRLLPAPAQLLLKRGTAVFADGDWAAPVARLRQSEHDFIERTTRAHRRLGDRKRVLLFSFQQVPPWLSVEYGVGAALELRGHYVRGILCNGLLPVCEMSLGGTERPSCDVCSGWLERYEDAFGFSFGRLTDWLSTSDRVRAEQLIAETADSALTTLRTGGVDVGSLARRELQRAARGFAFEPAADPAYRQWLISAVLLVWLAGRLLDREQPDIIIAGSGRTLPSACLWAVARRRGIRVVTWDAEATFDDGIVFSHDEAAPLIPLDDAWRTAAAVPLTPSQARQLHDFLDGWAQRHHPTTPLSDPATLRGELGLRPDAPTVLAFTNSAWDVAALDRDAGFESMFDWLFALVEFARSHSGVDVVIRAHPAEAHPALDLRSRTPVRGEMLKRFRALPSNLRVIDGTDTIDSVRARRDVGGCHGVHIARWSRDRRPGTAPMDCWRYNVPWQGFHPRPCLTSAHVRVAGGREIRRCAQP